MPHATLRKHRQRFGEYEAANRRQLKGSRNLLCADATSARGRELLGDHVESVLSHPT